MPSKMRGRKPNQDGTQPTHQVLFEQSFADNAATDISSAVTRFEQQKAIYCAPACCQMLCDKYHITIVQRDAFDKIEVADIEPNDWHSDPRGVATYLANTISTSASVTFADNSFTDQQAAINKIFYTLNQLHVPCVVLFLKGNHWVVVDKIRVSESADGTRTLIGIWVQDPWFNQPPERYIALKDVLDTYMLPDQWGTHWKNQYVLISDPPRTGLFTIRLGVPRVLGGSTGEGVEGLALANLEEHGFANITPIHQGGGAPVLVPLKVNYLGRTDFYYLVPLDASQAQEFQDYIYVALEGSDNGKLLEVAALSHTLDIFNDAEAMTQLATIYPHATITVDPAYYWQASFELRSRFQVARRFQHDGIEGYLLPNGTVVDRLHEPDKGGG